MLTSAHFRFQYIAKKEEKCSWSHSSSTCKQMWLSCCPGASIQETPPPAEQTSTSFHLCMRRKDAPKHKGKGKDKPLLACQQSWWRLCKESSRRQSNRISYPSQNIHHDTLQVPHLKTNTNEPIIPGTSVYIFFHIEHLKHPQNFL